MRRSGLPTLLRRLYLAASELHPGVMLALLLGHMALGWLLLGWAGEADLARPVGDEAVADIADGADEGLVLAAELGPQPSHVDVDGPGPAEVVVAPDLLEQLRAAEHPARVLREELQQLELLVGEVEGRAVEARARLAQERESAGQTETKATDFS